MENIIKRLMENHRDEKIKGVLESNNAIHSRNIDMNKVNSILDRYSTLMERLK
jgi:hypothetical protein